MVFDDFVFRKKKLRPGEIKCPKCGGQALTSKNKKLIICSLCGFHNIPYKVCKLCGR